MSPKYRGGSDDWLDNEKLRSGLVRKKKAGQGAPPARARELAPEEANGTVAEVFRKQARVRLDGTSGAGAGSGEAEPRRELLCNYRMAALVGKSEEVRERSPVAVGDRVRVEGDVITGLAARANRLVRPAPDRDEGVLHVLVANIEILVIVTAAHEPEFSPGLVDRFLVAASAQGIHTILVVNKVDLLREQDTQPWAVYGGLGVELLEVSAKRGDHVPDLFAKLHGRKAAFCGHSGVGKTSLLRALLNSEIGRVGEVSESTGKGRHTTTGALLLPGTEGTIWIDTPGVREFGLVDVTAETLGEHFPEIREAAARCAQEGCTHLDEEGCAARELPRYASFRRMRASLAAGEH